MKSTIFLSAVIGVALAAPAELPSDNALPSKRDDGGWWDGIQRDGWCEVYGRDYSKGHACTSWGNLQSMTGFIGVQGQVTCEGWCNSDTCVSKNYSSLIFTL
ncbi:hypothetical protein BGZ63DRAFT_386777, partial [Mariannaea sp. PMI_226]